MNRSRQWLVAISFFVSFAAVTLLVAALGPGVAADNGDTYFVVCKHEDLDRDREWTSMASDPPLEGWRLSLSGPRALWLEGTTPEHGCLTFPPVVEKGTTYTVCEVLKPGWTNTYRYASADGPPGGELCTSDECCMSYYVPPDYAGPVEVLFGNYVEPVGGETELASRLALLAPWLGLGAVVVLAILTIRTLVLKAGSA